MPLLTAITLLTAWLSVALAQQPPNGTGCYDVGTHRCDCIATETECAARQHTWTNRCSSCVHPECTKKNSWGCFSRTKHSCECKIPKSTCEHQMSLGFHWTHQCWSCCHHSEWGCYVPSNGPNAGCHCDTSEGRCSTDFPGGSWSYNCHVCATTPTQAPRSSDEDGNAVGIVIATCIAVVVVCLIIGVVTIYWIRSRAQKPGHQEGTGGVVVGAPVTGDIHTKA